MMESFKRESRNVLISTVKKDYTFNLNLKEWEDLLTALGNGKEIMIETPSRITMINIINVVAIELIKE